MPHSLDSSGLVRSCQIAQETKLLNKLKLKEKEINLKIEENEKLKKNLQDQKKNLKSPTQEKDLQK